MSLVILKLSPKELILLKEKKILPKSSHLILKKEKRYGFYSHQLLYGIYRVKRENQNYYFLAKNSFRPLRLWGNLDSQKKFIAQPEWVTTTWKNRNHLRGKLLLISEEDDHNYYFNFYHHLLPEFKKTLTLKKNLETLELITRTKNLLVSHNTHTLLELQGLGSRLFELGGFSAISPLLSNRITYSPTPPSFPIEILFNSEISKSDKQGFFWRENPIVYSFPSLERIRKKFLQRLNSFSLMTTEEDPPMIQEMTAIKNVFDCKKYFSTQFLTHGKKEMLLNLLEEDFLHFTCHGKEDGEHEFQFIHKNKAFLSLSDIKRQPRTPTVVFFSTCFSDYPQLREIFFERGSQTLITSQGPLFSYNLPEALAEFYRRLLMEKMTVLESYTLLVKKLIQLNDINAVKLRLYGHGGERLYSF